MLNLLPPSHFRTLYDVSVTEEGGSRGLANSKHVILNALDIENEKEFVAVFVHELGHVVDLGVFKGTSEENSGFFDMGSPIPIDDQSIEFYGIVWEGEDIKLPGVTRDDFVSGYASWNMFEDFAETYIFYILHEKHFQELLKKSERLAKKHQFIKDKVFGGRIYDFYAGDAYPEDIFDTTVLNFDLEKFLILAQEEKEKRYIASRARSKRKGRYKRRGKAPVYKIRVARTGGRGHGQS